MQNQCLSLSALLLVLLAALLHASWRVVVKKASGDGRFNQRGTPCMAGGVMVLGLAWAWALAWG